MGVGNLEMPCMGLTEEGSNSVSLAPVPSTKGVVELGRTEVTDSVKPGGW